MAIRRGERWRCQNQECRSEILVTVSSEAEGDANPRCSCGSIMKQPYARPEIKTYSTLTDANRGMAKL